MLYSTDYADVLDNLTYFRLKRQIDIMLVKCKELLYQKDSGQGQKF